MKQSNTFLETATKSVEAKTMWKQYDEELLEKYRYYKEEITVILICKMQLIKLKHTNSMPPLRNINLDESLLERSRHTWNVLHQFHTENQERQGMLSLHK
jgi:hypothetical protein